MRISRERASELLEAIPDMVGREYFEAIAEGTLPQYFLELFQTLQLFSDDLPGERLVAEWHPDYPYMKCRGNCIISVNLSLSRAVADRIIKDDGVVGKVSRFGEHEWNFQKGSKGEYWTQPEEIDLINDTLDTVISHLNKEYELNDNREVVEQKFQVQLAKTRKGWGV